MVSTFVSGNHGRHDINIVFEHDLGELYHEYLTLLHTVIYTLELILSIFGHFVIKDCKKNDTI